MNNKDKCMNKKYKQTIKKHVNLIKSMYPELYIEVIKDWDEIFISIDSQDISNREEYVDLIYSFIKEYHRKGLANVFWGVNSSLTKDDLHLLEDDVKTPKKEKIIEYPITQKQFARR